MRKLGLVTFGYILLFTASQIVMSKFSPWLRLSLLALIPFIYWFKTKFDGELYSALSKKQIFTLIKVVFVLFALFRAGGVVRKLAKEEVRTEDIAIVYVKTIKLFFQDHINPYNTTIDPYPVETSIGRRVYAGTKYTPLQMFFYAPFTLFFDLKGVYLGNLIAYIGILLLIFSAMRPLHPGLPYLAGALFLSSDFFFNRCVGKGTNDIYPTMFALMSYLELLKSRSMTSGLYLGLSFASKQLPGGLFVLAFLAQKKWKTILWSAIPVLLFVVPFLFTGWQGFYDNAFEFNLIRPVRETSILVDLPNYLHRLIPALGLLSVIGMAIWGNKKNSKLNMDNGWLLFTIVPIIFIITSKMSPTNYFVWVLPFFTIWLFTPIYLEGDAD